MNLRKYLFGNPISIIPYMFKYIRLKGFNPDSQMQKNN